MNKYYKILVRDTSDNTLWSYNSAFMPLSYPLKSLVSQPLPFDIIQYEEGKDNLPRKDQNPFLFVFNKLENAKKMLAGLKFEAMGIEIWEVEAEQDYTYIMIGETRWFAERFYTGTRFVKSLRLIKRVETAALTNKQNVAS